MTRGFPLVSNFCQLLIVAIVSSTVACGGDGGGEGPVEAGTVRVTVEFSGTGPDPAGPIVSLDDTVSRQGVGAPATFETAAGDHQVTLHGLHARCIREGSATQTAAVVSGRTTDISFSVSCRDVDQLALLESGGALSIIDADGQRLHSVFDARDSTDSPAWSRDGRRLAFTYFLDPDQDRGALYVVNADGTALRKIWNDPVYTPIKMAWSPDGGRLAVVADYNPPSSIIDYHKIVLMDVDGSNVVESAPQNGVMSMPSWAPDGGRFVFTTYDLYGGGGINGTFSGDREGAGQERIASAILSADWSPDGARIVLANGNLVTIRPDGSDPVTIPACAIYCHSALWSPDGGRLLLDDQDDVRVVTLDGTLQTSVHTGGIFGTPSWSGSGTFVAWTNLPAISLTIIRADGTDPLVLGPSDLHWPPSPVWRP